MKFNLPQIIKINGSFIEVKFEVPLRELIEDELVGITDHDSSEGDIAAVEAEVPESYEALGHYDYRQRVFRLHPDVPRETTINTLMHECLHAILEHAGVQSHDEFYVRCFAFGIISLLRENPELVRAIMVDPLENGHPVELRLKEILEQQFDSVQLAGKPPMGVMYPLRYHDLLFNDIPMAEDYENENDWKAAVEMHVEQARKKFESEYQRIDGKWTLKSDPAHPKADITVTSVQPLERIELTPAEEQRLFEANMAKNASSTMENDDEV